MKLSIKTVCAALVMSIMLLISQHVLAAASSTNVVIIGGTTLDTNLTCSPSGSAANDMGATVGGCLPLNTTAYPNLSAFTFTPMAPSAVTAASLAPFDTAVLNVASSAMACKTGNLSATAQTALVSFVAAGNKLIIYDSECTPGPSYDWLPYKFTTANPGALGASGGTLTVVVNNTLSSNNPSDASFIDTATLASTTDAVGDMNVMTSNDANWCLDMVGTNALQVSGPVHTFATFPTGTDMGLFLYNGLDQNYQAFTSPGQPILAKIWILELQQPFNPSGLLTSAQGQACIPITNISLAPLNATNNVGTSHTVTATVKDVLQVPQTNILVTFSITAGPNAGATGTCSANVNCTTDANGEVSFTYSDTGQVPGEDIIQASFTDQQGTVHPSNQANKEWVVPPFTAGIMTGGGSISTADGTRVTHGFVLNCDISQGPNELEINWQGQGQNGAHKFHLTGLGTAACFDDPAFSPNPPAAGFDTYEGFGIGTLDGVPAAEARWTFTDQGEPGKNDTVQISIQDDDGNVVLDVPLTKLKGGNQQAHKR